MDVWGVGTRSLPFSLWQLIWRPGYLMRDYISGKRQVSFPPVKMMMIVAIAALFFFSWFEPEETTKTAEVTSTGLRYVIDVITQWVTIHEEWWILLAFSFMIVPIWSLFREAPKYRRHTLPQGFYVQVFAGTQFIVVTIIIYILALLLFHKYEGNYMGAASFILIVPLMLLIDFKQLFGYGWWGTLWRALMAVPMGMLLLKIIAQAGRVVLYLTEHGVGARLWEMILTGVDRAVLLWLLMEIVGVINRKEWRGSNWWQVMKRPALAALVYLLITGVCYALGIDGGIASIIKSYLALVSE